MRSVENRPPYAPKAAREAPSRGNPVLALAGFVLTAATAVVLLISTAVVWLAEAIRSLPAAMLILGTLCLVAAAVIYLVGLRDPLRRMQEQLETVYDVARSAREGYQWIMRKFTLLTELRTLFGELFGSGSTAERQP